MLDYISQYILTVVIVLVLMNMVFLLVIIRNITTLRSLKNRIRVLENFENILNHLTTTVSVPVKTNQEGQQSEYYFEEREETKTYQGDTRLERLTNEFKHKMKTSKNRE